MGTIPKKFDHVHVTQAIVPTLLSLSKTNLNSNNSNSNNNANNSYNAILN